jgi:hypothetical protein
MMMAKTTGCPSMTMRRSNRTLRRQVFTSVAVQSTTGTRTRGTAFGSNETEARARGAAGVVGAREAGFGNEVVDVVCAVAIERDEAGDRRDGAG